jgi:hypothetical protein
LSDNGWLEETTPQANAHIGGNQVMGFKSSATVESSGRSITTFLQYNTKCQLGFTLLFGFRLVNDAKTA